MLERLINILTYDPKSPLIFSSGLFLFLFLGFSFIYMLLQRRSNLRILFVTLFSYYFYYKSSGFYFFLLAVITTSDYFIAEAIGRDHGAKCLVTGENLGQVASQTMDAMAVTGAVVHMPIFHPLIGMDKEEIVTVARRIGTLETSILPYEDCCTVFTPKHPKTKPVLAQVEAEEQKLDVEGLIARAIANTEKTQIRYYEDEQQR